jgi:hypothetical protein
MHGNVYRGKITARINEKVDSTIDIIYYLHTTNF